MSFPCAELNVERLRKNPPAHPDTSYSSTKRSHRSTIHENTHTRNTRDRSITQPANRMRFDKNPRSTAVVLLVLLMFYNASFLSRKASIVRIRTVWVSTVWVLMQISKRDLYFRVKVVTRTVCSTADARTLGWCFRHAQPSRLLRHR